MRFKYQDKFTVRAPAEVVGPALLKAITEPADSSTLYGTLKNSTLKKFGPLPVEQRSDTHFAIDCMRGPWHLKAEYVVTGTGTAGVAEVAYKEVYTRRVISPVTRLNYSFNHLFTGKMKQGFADEVQAYSGVS